jgi:xylulokinase
VTFIHDVNRRDKLWMSAQPKAAIVGITPDTKPSEVYRAALEAFGYALRRNLEVASPEVRTRRVFAAGGGARTDLWRQVVSDIIGHKQMWHSNSSGAFGGALLAGHAVGVLALNAIRDRQLRESVVNYPSRGDQAAYEEGYARYRGLVKAMEQVNA